MLQALTAVVAALGLVLAGTAAPAAAQAAAVDGARDVLVVDVVNSTSPSSSHSRYDSASASAPVAAPSPDLGGVRLARPVTETSGPGIEVLPADAAPLAVGTYTEVRGRWSSGSPRPVPVVRLLTAAGGCSSFMSTPPSSQLVVHDVEHDSSGAVVRLSASFRIPCSNTGAVATGELRYRSAAHYAAASSFGTTLGTVVSGSRTPVEARIANTGSVPLELGAPTPVDRGPAAPRLELADGGQDCSAAPLPVGGQCTLALEYVDDGIRGGGYVAELHLPAPALVRGHVSVLVTVREVVAVPAPVTGLRATAAYDGVALFWDSPSSGTTLPDGWRVRRVDSGTPVEVATLPWHVRSWVDTSLAKGEQATYEVAGFSAAGEAAPVPVTVARQDRPDPPPAVERRTLVMDELAGIGVADSAAGTAVHVSDLFSGTTAVTGGGMVLHLPRLHGPGTFPVGPGPGQLPVLAYARATTCGSTTGTADVREAWVRADGTVHRVDADLHLLCAGRSIEVALRVGTDAPFTAVTTDPAALTDLHGVVGGEPGVRTVSVRNAGTAPVGVGAASVTGPDAAEFTVDSGTCGALLQPGTDCSLELRFAPVRSGQHAAALELPVETALRTRVVALRGSSAGPPAVRVPQAQPVLGRTLLQWAAGADGGSPVTGLQVQRADETGAFVAVADLPADASSWVDERAEPGRRHRYRLLTANRHGSVEPTAAQTVEVTGADEELLAAVATAGQETADLASVPVGDGRPVPMSTGQDVDLPAVSPDGRSVAYVVHDADGDSGLWLRSVAGTSPAPRVLVDAPDVDETDPAWSPDGTRLCYSRLTWSAAQVWCVGAAGGAVPAPLPGGADAAEPSWLPDGTGLVLTDLSQDETALARVTSTGTRSRLPGTAGGSWPTVSPAGDRIAFVVTDDEGLDHLRTVPVSGGTATDLASAHELYERPAWSPDGQRLAVPTIGLEHAPEVTVWTAAQGATPARVDRHRAAAGDDVLAVTWRRQDRTAPTITFPGAPVLAAANVRLPVRVLDDTVPVGGLQVACTLDGRAVGRCAAGWAGTLAAGAHRLVVTATDAHGRTATATHVFTVDTTPPVVRAAALPAFVLADRVSFSYAATDPAGVASYDVRYRRAAWNAAGFSSMTVPAGWASTTARSRTLLLAPGSEYCLSVRARDRLGNLSAWSSEQCTAAPLDDRALARVTAGWTSATTSTALAGTLTRTTRAGARLARPSAQARRVAVVATTCPTCGTLDVLVGSTRIGTLRLVSSTTRARQVLHLPLQAGVRTGTITLRSTTTGRPVVVDGLGLRRS